MKKLAVVSWRMSGALQKAINIVGSQNELARRLRTQNPSVNQGYVWKWIRRPKGPPAEYVLAIESATERQVTRYELRPDVYGSAPWSPEKMACPRCLEMERIFHAGAV